jgi:hypothetical protein
MRATITLAAGAAFLALGSLAASAGPSQAVGLQARGQEAAVQNVDWYCGPRCQYWRHRHWEERHWQRDGYYHQGGYYHRPHRYYQYGYNHSYSYGY